MKIYRIIFVILFLLILVLPLCFMNLKPDQISEIDNSKLPEKSTIKNVSSLENYLSKRLGFREDIINFYTKANDILLGKMVHPTYTYGKKGYVFFKTYAETKDDEYLDTFAELVKNMQDYTTERGSYFLFVINPTKISVYSEYLPAGYNFTNYRITYLKQKLDELGVNYIDNTEYLTKLAKDTQVFNKQYDAGHWNDTGAFYGMNNIYKKLQSDGIKIEQLDTNDYNVQYEKKNTLPVSEFEIDDKAPQYYIKKANYVTDNKYEDYIETSERYSYYRKTINQTVDNDYNVLFFRGSYMGNKEKFVSTQFKQTNYVHNYDNSINFDYYFNITQPDIVLFETVEYAIRENYYSSKEIINKTYNKNYDEFANIEVKSILNFETDKIKNEIGNNYKNNIALTTINLTKENFEYAYLKIEGQIYDFCYDKSNCYITLDTVLLYNKNIEIILLSKDGKTKELIQI